MKPHCFALLIAVVSTVLTVSSRGSNATVIFGNSGLVGGSRWDVAPRYVSGNERSLDGGLRYSLQGGSYEAFRDLLSWQGAAPDVADFQAAVEAAFEAWTVYDPASGLRSDLEFVPDLGTPVVGPGAGGTVNIAGAEIDLLATDDGYLWNPGDSSQRGETYFSTTGITNVELTSGITGYVAYAIAGADIKFNNDPSAHWTLPVFQTILTHEIGHTIGLGDVDVASTYGKFLDDNYDGTNSATALATLTNSWAGLVNPLNPSLSPLALYSVANGNPGVDTPGVDILMETNIPGALFGNPYPLQNDDFGGRQFLYPDLVGDITGDAAVDVGDFTLWADDFGETGDGLAADFNADNRVDIGDFTIWADHFGTGLSPDNDGDTIVVPEPAGFSLLVIGLFAVLVYGARRRVGWREVR